MGRPKGRKNRKWTVEEKASLVKQYLESGIGMHKFAVQEDISKRLLFEWVKRFQAHGKKGLENKKKMRNPYAALAASKSLSEVERLRLTVAKQKVELGG